MQQTTRECSGAEFRIFRLKKGFESILCSSKIWR